MREATAGCRAVGIQADHISIHASREGGDAAAHSCCSVFFWISIHASREGGDLYIPDIQKYIEISIHASREGGDLKTAGFDTYITTISIHASREGGDKTG